MGFGDALMSVGDARALHKLTGKPVLIVGAHGRPMWSEVFEGNPYIIKRFTGKACVRMVSGGGVRPYIAQKTPTKWFWKPYTPKPGELYFKPEELAFAEPYRGAVMIEPNVKNLGHDNKAWSNGRWGDVVRALNIRWVQCVQPGTRPLSTVVAVHTPSFRYACAVLSVCKAFVGTDGGLMHAAAATGVRSVILWSEYTSPLICGYKTMVNLRHAGPPCGNRLNCPSCREAMDKITVDEVVTAVKGIL